MRLMPHLSCALTAQGNVAAYEQYPHPKYSLAVARTIFPPDSALEIGIVECLACKIPGNPFKFQAGEHLNTYTNFSVSLPLE